MSVAGMLRDKHNIGDWKDFSHSLEVYSNYKLKYCNFFTFCFVRNPWVRFASNYLYFKRGGRSSDHLDLHTKRLIERYKTFEDLVGNFHEFKSECKVCHFDTQIKWVDTLPPNFIGKVESFDKDIAILFDKVNLRLPGKIQHRNSNKKNDYKSIYNTKTIERVGELYKHDVDRFNYTFDL